MLCPTEGEPYSSCLSDFDENRSVIQTAEEWALRLTDRLVLFLHLSSLFYRSKSRNDVVGLEVHFSSVQYSEKFTFLIKIDKIKINSNKSRL